MATVLVSSEMRNAPLVTALGLDHDVHIRLP
jgi:hypothetical protein